MSNFLQQINDTSITLWITSHHTHHSCTTHTHIRYAHHTHTPRHIHTHIPHHTCHTPHFFFRDAQSTFRFGRVIGNDLKSLRSFNEKKCPPNTSHQLTNCMVLMIVFLASNLRLRASVLIRVLNIKFLFALLEDNSTALVLLLSTYKDVRMISKGGKRGKKRRKKRGEKREKKEGRNETKGKHIFHIRKKRKKRAKMK